MKTIGLIGGMSWESTAVYYDLLNRYARERLGGLHSAELLLWSFDFAAIEALQTSGDWASATERMVDVAKRLETGGADCLVICTNTMHRMADEVESKVAIPLIHIADATAAAIRSRSVARPLLLATRYTMEEDFYKGRLRERHGIEVVVPGDADRAIVHDTIYNELCQGVVSASSKQSFLDIVERVHLDHGVDGIILGCTEIGLLIGPDDFDLPTFDTTELHARAAIDFALD